MRMDERSGRDARQRAAAETGRLGLLVLVLSGRRMHHHIAGLHDEMLAGRARPRRMAIVSVRVMMAAGRMLQMVQLVRLRLGVQLLVQVGRCGSLAASRYADADTAAAAATAAISANLLLLGCAVGRTAAIGKQRKRVVVLGDRHAARHALDVPQNLRIVVGDLRQLRFVGAVEVGDADQVVLVGAAAAAATAGYHVQSGRGWGHGDGTPLHLNLGWGRDTLSSTRLFA